MEENRKGKKLEGEGTGAPLAQGGGGLGGLASQGRLAMGTAIGGADLAVACVFK